MANESVVPGQQPHQRKAQKTSGGLFDDLSIAQVTAGALAAVTSMLLSAKIGIAGSVIGVAVGSVVSTVASQVYKKFLQKSAEKLREAVPDGVTNVLSTDRGAADAQAASWRADRARIAQVNATARASSWGPKPSAGGWVSPADSAPLRVLQRTAVADRLSRSSEPEERHGMRQTQTPRLSDPTVQDDATIRRVMEERATKRRTQRIVIGVSVASALVAVLLSAGAVNLFTQGQGIGPRAGISSDGFYLEQPAQDDSATAAPSSRAQNGAAAQQQDGHNAVHNDMPDSADTSSQEQGAGQQSNATQGSQPSDQAGSGSSQQGQESSGGQSTGQQGTSGTSSGTSSSTGSGSANNSGSNGSTSTGNSSNQGSLGENGTTGSSSESASGSTSEASNAR